MLKNTKSGGWTVCPGHRISSLPRSLRYGPILACGHFWSAQILGQLGHFGGGWRLSDAKRTRQAHTRARTCGQTASTFQETPTGQQDTERAVLSVCSLVSAGRSNDNMRRTWSHECLCVMEHKHTQGARTHARTHAFTHEHAHTHTHTVCAHTRAQRHIHKHTPSYDGVDSPIQQMMCEKQIVCDVLPFTLKIVHRNVNGTCGSKGQNVPDSAGVALTLNFACVVQNCCEAPKLFAFPPQPLALRRSHNAT